MSELNSTTHYELVFAGQTLDSIPVGQVKKNMAKLFKANDAQLARMFSGKAVVLRNKLDKATALKYQATLKKHGAVCKISLMATSRPSQRVKSATSTSTSTSIPTPTTASTPDLSIIRQPEVEKPSSRARFDLGGDSEVVSANRKPAAQHQTGSANTETGQLPIAGEKVEQILSDKHIELSAPGERLSEEVAIAEPMFEHLDEINVAPVGADLQQQKPAPPPPAPDVSHISVAPVGADMGELKREADANVPDTSHIKLM